MLPMRHRLRAAAEFSATVRSGARSGRRNVVLYARLRPEADHAEPTRFGFIVSKAVGNAVTRNLVKRRLRAVAAQELPSLASGYDVVVRALPASAQATWAGLSADARRALDNSCQQAAELKTESRRRRHSVG
ncbi:MAG: ribonuclease P protein component [Micrococcaceae bacterium]|uniref:ribonuclease P protein component n=1 Tax=unclassified Arthrobacter TaxID=235627 RepID=UPI00264CEECF|nr:ribonuclease P protein component [Yaniella sp.]MDN5812310.1 ribonuclease P protein component [Micrococcaceae bacterium]MDN5823720.1 ribonuclease P protein component [Micrococcaceae bacterium]MDN5878649.1 ribonuclease P protein component [Micrococcaceae bacterium]MDN5886133.1 ribonuclease P protein component [Micrococcaceae bacterium]